MSIFDPNNKPEYKIDVNQYFNVTTTGTVNPSFPLANLTDGNNVTFTAHTGDVSLSSYTIIIDRKPGPSRISKILGVRLSNASTSHGIIDCSFYFRAKDNTLLQQQNITSMTPGSTPVDIEFNSNDYNKSVNRINLQVLNSLETAFNAITELEIYAIVDTESYDVEFNDSVLTTKAWNSSRYDGRQLSAHKINRVSTLDVGNNNKTPIIQHYSRNIYVGNDVVSLNQGEEIDDENLMSIDGFSYLQTKHYITINNDDTITHNRLESNEDNEYEKVGFYQAFYDDFPQQSTCNLVLLDNKVSNKTKPFYKIYFNGGQFQKLFTYNPTDFITSFGADAFTLSYNISYYTSSLLTSDGGPQGVATSRGNFLRIKSTQEALPNSLLYLNPKIQNLKLIKEFSSKDLSTILVEESISEATQHVPLNAKLIYDDMFAYQQSSSYTNDKRFFLTFYESGSEQPIRTISSGSLPHVSPGVGSTVALRTQNIAEISTTEIISASLSSGSEDLDLFFSDKTPLNQPYNTRRDFTNTLSATTSTSHVGFSGIPELATIAPIQISQVKDDVPSLLVNLDKTAQLPRDIGDKPFVILPTNIHPYIKENLNLLLSRAGINASDDATTVIQEQVTKKSPIRPRPLTAEERALRILEME